MMNKSNFPKGDKDCDFYSDIPQVARYIQIEFEGYFMNRLATDPDPTDDPYGTSGYTMALAKEPILDQKIRLQYDPKEAPVRDCGNSSLTDAIKHGVRVKQVLFDGEIDAHLSELFRGAKVDLLDWYNKKDGQVLPGPTFVSNNNTVGSDDTMAFVVEPFILKIHKKDGVALKIKARDDLIKGKPNCFAVDIPQPRVYARRFSQPVVQGSDEAHQAIGVYDEYGYFRDRRVWLENQIHKLQAKLATLTAEGDDKQRQDIEVDIQNFKTRVFQIESWGNRVTNKLGFLSRWSHRTNGTQNIKVDGQPADCPSTIETLQGKAIDDQPWSVEYWFGGWDGDLLSGYMRGTLSIPFEPTNEKQC
jgi:hypothetical protein